ncbi:hypothetical protein CDEF62S_04327 [Castellaniella defragrans]
MAGAAKQATRWYQQTGLPLTQTAFDQTPASYYGDLGQWKSLVAVYAMRSAVTSQGFRIRNYPAIHARFQQIIDNALDGKQSAVTALSVAAAEGNQLAGQGRPARLPRAARRRRTTGRLHRIPSSTRSRHFSPFVVSDLARGAPVLQDKHLSDSVRCFFWGGGMVRILGAALLAGMLAGCTTPADRAWWRAVAGLPPVPGQFSFDWRMTGDPLAPLQVFDDGRQTWLQYPADQAVPAVFERTASGDRLLRPRREGDYRWSPACRRGWC